MLGELEAWTPGEDELLGAGLRRFGTKYDIIQKYLLPAKMEKDMHDHQKTRSKQSAPPNPIKVQAQTLYRPAFQAHAAGDGCTCRGHKRCYVHARYRLHEMHCMLQR